jgi:hypothetical protein
MKKYLLGLLSGFLAISTLAYAAITTDIITLGFGGVDRARLWVSTGGRIGFQSHIASDSTAIDLWPTSGTQPTQHSISEITLQRKLWGGSGLERFNISAMVDGSKNGAYRFGVEREGTGIHRDIIFCFEDVTPGAAICNFKVTLNGVFVSDDGGTTWRTI